MNSVQGGRHFFAPANMPGKRGAVHFTKGFFCDEHGTRRLTPPTPNLGIARGLSGYRQIPLPQQFSQSKNSSLRRACAFSEVSRDYCILLPFPSSARYCCHLSHLRPIFGSRSPRYLGEMLERTTKHSTRSFEEQIMSLSSAA